MFQIKPSKPVLFSVVFKRLYALKAIAVVTLISFGFVLTYFLTATPITAQAATNNTLNFQARLETSSGAIVPDGDYNVEFKIANDPTASDGAQGTCSGSCLWMETRTGANQVHVANGYLTVNLGSVTSLPTTVDWDQPLYLTMNIGGTSSPSWDGEMSPRLLLTAVPYAFQAQSAEQLQELQGSYTDTLQFATGTLTSNQTISLPNLGGGSFGLLALQAASPGTQQTGNFNISGTGVAGTLEAGTFDTASSGTLYIGTTHATGITFGQNVTFANGASRSLVVATAGSGAGNQLTIHAGNGASGSTGGNLLLEAGANGTTNGTPGSVIVKANGGDSTTAFEVQSSTGAQVLDVDSANGRVGIGTGAPSRPLTIATSTSSTNSLPLLLQQAGSGDTGVEYQTAGSDFYTGVDSTDGAFKIASSASANGEFTVGNTSPGTQSDVNSGYTQAYEVTPSASGSVASMSVYFVSVNAGNPLVQFGVYSNSGGAPGTLLGNSSVTTATTGWDTFPISGVNLTSGTSYWIAMSEEGASQFGGASSGGSTAYESGAYPLPSTFRVDDTSTWKPAFYLTVTNAGGSDNFGGTNLFTLGGTGAATFQNSTNSTAAFQVQNASGYDELSIDTSGNKITLGNITSTSGHGIAGTLVLADGTSDNFGATIQTTGTLSGNSIFQLNVGSANGTYQLCTTLSVCTGYAAASTGSYIQLDPSVAQTDSTTSSSIFLNKTGASGNILELQKSGSDVFTVANNGSLTVNATTLNGSSLQFGSGSTATIQPAASQSLNITGHNNSTLSTDAGTLTIQSASTLSLGNAVSPTITMQSASGGTINVGNNGVANTIQIGQSGTSAVTQTIAIGNGGTGSTTNLTLGNINGGSTTIQGAAGISLVTNSSSAGVNVKTNTDSASAFQVQNHSGTSILSVDTSAGQVILGTSNVISGALVFNNASDGSVIKLQAPATSSGYTLTLPSGTPSVGECLRTSAGDATQLTFSSCVNTTASISYVNEWDGSATNDASLSVSPANIGDLMVVMVKIPTNGRTVASVSGGGVASGGWTYANAQAYSSSTVERVEMWYGVVSATGSSSVSITYTGGSAGSTYEIAATEFTAVGVSPTTTWNADTSGGIHDGTSSTTPNYPSLTATNAGEAYVGYMDTANTGQDGNTGGVNSGFTFLPPTGQNDVITYNPSTGSGTAYQPQGKQSSTGQANAVAAIFNAVIASTAINNSTSLQEANFNVQAASAGTVAGTLQAAASGTGDILDLDDGSGNVVDSFSSTGAALFKPGSTGNNSTTFFRVQDASGNSVLTVDTQNDAVTIATTNSSHVALKIDAGTSGYSGLQLSQLTSSSSTSSSFSQLLGVDSAGNVGLSSAGVSLTSPALAYWDGKNDPAVANSGNSYPQATVQSEGANSFTPTFAGSGNGEQLTNTTNTNGGNGAGQYETGDVNWNFSQVPFEETQFQFKAGGGSGADGTWFYSYANGVPATEYGAAAPTGTAFSQGYLIYFSEYHQCAGISWGSYTDGNQCSAGGSGHPLAATAAGSLTNIGNNTWHSVDVMILDNQITVRLDGQVILNYSDVYNRDTSHLNYGFGARTGSSTNNHYIKNLLVTKLGTDASEYNINDVTPLTNNVQTTGNNMYWQNSTGSLGIDTYTPSAQLEINTTSTGAVGQIVQWGASGQTGDLLELQNNSGTILSRFTSAGNLDVASTLDTQTATTLNLGGTATGINLNDNTTVGSNISFAADGSATFQDTTNSASAFKVNNNGSTAVLSVDTNSTNNRVIIGTGTTVDSSPTLLVLDNSTCSSGNCSSGDPSAIVNGAMYYNTSTRSFRCGEDGQWMDCAGAVNVQTSESGWIDGHTNYGSFYEFSGGTNTTYTAPSGDCQAGVVYMITASGTFSQDPAWGLHVGILDNSSAVVSTPNVFPNSQSSDAVNKAWSINATITCDSSSKVYINGSITFDNNNSSVALPYTVLLEGSATGNSWSTGSNALGIGWYWNSQDPSANVNTARMDQFIVQRLAN